MHSYGPEADNCYFNLALSVYEWFSFREEIRGAFLFFSQPKRRIFGPPLPEVWNFLWTGRVVVPIRG